VKERISQFIGEATRRLSAVGKTAKASLGKDNLARWVPLAILVTVITTSFIYGWYFDHSKPFAGRGMADQTLYMELENKLSDGELPLPNQLHYTIGYPLMGVIANLFYSADPFMIVSFVLLLSSVLLCFVAARHMMGTYWALIFGLALLYWDGTARSLHLVSELFANPWSNQVIFFAFAFFF
jgi:hypothetical protein